MDGRRRNQGTGGQPRTVAPAEIRSESSPRTTTVWKLKSAFATNDMERICKAVYDAVRRRGVTRVAQSAGVDRATLSRSLRHNKGLKLATMTNVLRALGCGLVVKVRLMSLGCPGLGAERLAHLISNGFRSGDLDLAVAAMAAAVRSQDNISELAREADLSRENLYRAFAYPRSPHIRTVLGVLRALELEVAVEPMQGAGHGADIAVSQAIPLGKVVT